jgi:anti-sigma B factor antagonist
MKTDSSQRRMRDGALTIRLTEDESCCTLALAGELDLANARTLTKALEQAEAGTGPVRIDLTELEFLDSTGISLLVAAHRKLGDDRLSLLPSEANAVRRVLALTGLDAELPFAPSQGGAQTGR